jgi:hypothetical protein
MRKLVTTGGDTDTEHTRDPNGLRKHDTNIRDIFTSVCYS